MKMQSSPGSQMWNRIYVIGDGRAKFRPGKRIICFAAQKLEILGVLKILQDELCPGELLYCISSDGTDTYFKIDPGTKNLTKSLFDRDIYTGTCYIFGCTDEWGLIFDVEEGFSILGVSPDLERLMSNINLEGEREAFLQYLKMMEELGPQSKAWADQIRRDFLV